MHKKTVPINEAHEGATVVFCCVSASQTLSYLQESWCRPDDGLILIDESKSPEICVVVANELIDWPHYREHGLYRMLDRTNGPRSSASGPVSPCR